VAFGSPQDVEVRVGGGWVPGAMLGWRHDDTGDCEAWVQLRTDGPAVVAGAGSWVGLTDVRLPEPHLSLAPPPATAARPAGVHSGPGRPGRARRHRAEGTAEQYVVAPGAAGRHRAPARDDAGRHRAATAELPAVTPGSPGRGEDGTATAAAAAPDATVVAPAVVAPAVVAPAVGAPGPVAPAEGDPDLLTRPIRLGDLVPAARGGRPPVRPSA
jgi:hypothetical protein